MGFGSFRGQRGWPCSKHESQRQNCWEAVGLGTWFCLIYHHLAFHCAKSAERHWLLVGATLCDGNPLNVQKICPERTEKLSSSHWGNCTFCDLDGRKLLNQLTLDCGKVLLALWPIPSSLLQRQICQNHRICVAAVSIAPKGILLILQWHRIRILQSDRRPVIQYNVVQTWGLLAAPLSEFANVCSWFIWVHST